MKRSKFTEAQIAFILRQAEDWDSGWRGSEWSWSRGAYRACPSFYMPRSETAFLDEGEGKPIALVHGFASNKEVHWIYHGSVSALMRAERRAPTLSRSHDGRS